MAKSTAKNPDRWADSLELHKLACLAFAHHYGKGREWLAYHEKVSSWTPNVDFTVGDQKCRIIPVRLNPSSKNTCFGYKTIGKVWERDYQKGHDVYILVGVYVPYVDFIGWIGRESLGNFRRAHANTNSYDIQEVATRPMSELL